MGAVTVHEKNFRLFSGRKVLVSGSKFRLLSLRENSVLEEYGLPGRRDRWLAHRTTKQGWATFRQSKANLDKIDLQPSLRDCILRITVTQDYVRD